MDAPGYVAQFPISLRDDVRNLKFKVNVDLDKKAFTVKLVEKDRTYDFMQLTHKAFIDDYQH